jgi:hypothetical protein
LNRSADWLHQALAWACFACHQSVEKALNGLHLRHGQRAWGHGLGPSCRDLAPAVSAALAASVSDPTVPRPTISAGFKARTPAVILVRLLTQSLLRWPEPEHPGLERVGLFGSYGRGLLAWPLAELPFSCDALVPTPSEHAELLASGSAMATALQRHSRWVWHR